MAITVPIVSEWQPKGLRKAIADFQKLETTGQKIGFGLKKAFLPATAAVAGLAVGAGVAAKAAAEDAAQQAELARQLKATTGATDEQIAANEEFIATTELAAAVSDADLRPALANLVRGTGDLTQAQNLLGIALDVSAATGKDLNAVTEAMAKAAQGEMTALKRLDPSLTAVIGSGADANEVFGALADTFGGAAAESANTVQGRFERMQIQLDNAAESIGYALLPIIEQLLPKLEAMATWVGENTDLVIGIGAAVGTFATAIIAANIAMKAWNAITVITAALNFVLAKEFTALWVATGVGIVIALIAVIVTLQMKFNILGKAVHALKVAFDVLWDGAKYVFGKIIDGINFLIRAWNKLPLVPDIPEINTAFLSMSDSMTTVAKSAEEIEATVGSADGELARFKNQAEASALMLDRALLPAVEKVGVSFNRASLELDAFYGRLDRKEGIAQFNEELDAIQEELLRLAPGTEEWLNKFEEGQRLVGDLSDEIKRIPAALELQLQLRGDLELMQRILNLAALPDTYRATAQDELRFLGGGSQSPSGVVQTVNINMAAGANGADVVQALQTEARRTGASQVQTAGNIRR